MPTIPPRARLNELPREDGSTDESVIARVLDGDKAFFALLVRRYNQRLFRVVRAIVRQDDDAEDVVQQAYVSAYRKLADFRGEASFATWLTRIAVNEALGRIRQQARRADISLVGHEGITASEEPGPEQDVLRREVARALETHVDALPDSLRIVFMLRDVEELPTAEVAACLEISEEAVRVRLHRARHLLQETLSSALGAADEAFKFAGERCDRILANTLERLDIQRRSP